MKNPGLLPCLLLLCLGAVLAAAHAQDKPGSAAGEINIFGLTDQSQVIYQTNGFWVGVNGIKVTYSNVVLTAHAVSLNPNTADVTADGAVFLQRGKELWTGEHLEYNFRTRNLRSGPFRTGLAPFFLAGAGLTWDDRTRTEIATNAIITTDDLAQPGVRVRAKRVKIIPGKSFEARDATVYVDNVPVAYLPYYSRSLERHPNNFGITPGYRSFYGPYLLGAYNWFWSTNLDGTVHLDYMERRGVGGGPEVRYDLGAAGQGSFEAYYLRDHGTGLDQSTVPLPDNRQRFTFTHQLTIRTNLTATVVVREQSDPYMIRDFFEGEYINDVQPNSFAEVNKLWPNFSLDVLAQPRLNDFFETVERLPDVKFSGLRQQVGGSPIYYESETSFGYYRHLLPSEQANPYAFSILGTNLAYSAFRADTFHQLLLPETLFGWLTVTPRVGGRFTHYGEVEMTGVSTNDQNREVFNTGAEVSLKASRIWRSPHSRLLDIDGLRHIIQPSVDYVYVPRPNVTPEYLPQFDSQLPSLWLLPIEYPDYNSIDSVDSQNTLRWGLRNQLQTKRKDGIEDLVNWALYTDWRLTPTNGQTTFSDAYSLLDFKPRSWVTLTSETRFDINNRQWIMANHSLTLQPNETWSWSIGHMYLRDDPALYPLFGPLYGNSFFTSRIFIRANENWGFRLEHQFDARTGTINGQYYSIYRDLRSWTAALTFRYLQSSLGGPRDTGIALTFSLKAFPRMGLNQDRDQPSLLLGS
ncbi:MAG: LPS assembly protein LptD [Verrucomicrobia bacterium]|nr:LPS assembly protein LptD [Verrucomicrobiota bacterium]